MNSPVGQRAIVASTAAANAVKDTIVLTRMALSLGRDKRGRPSNEASAPRRILIIDERVPDPLFGAGFPRAFEIVRALVDAGHRVDMYPMLSTPAERARVNSLFDGAVRFHKGEGTRGLRRLLWRSATTFDALIVSRPTTMRVFLDVSASSKPDGRPPLIYDAEAVAAPREKARRTFHPPAMTDAEYDSELRAELELVRGADAIMTVGPGDAAILASRLDTPTVVLPHAETNRTSTAGFEMRRDILFVGRLVGTAAQSPNVDSIDHFVREVMPLLDSAIGSDYRIHLAGFVESTEVAALASDRVVVHGVVPDLRPLYDRCRVFVAPTRFAAGIPHKVTEAMSEGIPCVVTRLLAEQLDADGSTCGIGDDASGFAKTCAQLYTDPVAWEAVRDGGFAYVERNCSPATFRQRLAEVLDVAISRRSP